MKIGIIGAGNIGATIASTGLRQSELFAVKWCDIDFAQQTMNVIRSIVYGVVGPCKTESSQKSVPVHPTVLEALAEWRHASTYNKSDDWVFAGRRYRGRKPIWARRSCANMFDQPRRGSEFKSGSDGTLSGTHIRLCYEVSGQSLR